MISKQKLFRTLKPIVAKVLDCNENKVSLETDLGLEHIAPIVSDLEEHYLTLDPEIRRNDFRSVQSLVDATIEEDEGVIEAITSVLDVDSVNAETTLDLLHIEQIMEKLGPKGWVCFEPYTKIMTVDELITALVQREKGEET